MWSSLQREDKGLSSTEKEDPAEDGWSEPDERASRLALAIALAAAVFSGVAAFFVDELVKRIAFLAVSGAILIALVAAWPRYRQIREMWLKVYTVEPERAVALVARMLGEEGLMYSRTSQASLESQLPRRYAEIFEIEGGLMVRVAAVRAAILHDPKYWSTLEVGPVRRDKDGEIESLKAALDRVMDASVSLLV